MKPLVAALAAVALASPTLAAALLSGPMVANRVYHGRQTKVRVDVAGVAHPILFDPRDVLPASAASKASDCPLLRNAASPQAAPAKLQPQPIAA